MSSDSEPVAFAVAVDTTAASARLLDQVDMTHNDNDKTPSATRINSTRMSEKPWTKAHTRQSMSISTTAPPAPRSKIPILAASKGQLHRQSHLEHRLSSSTSTGIVNSTATGVQPPLDRLAPMSRRLSISTSVSSLKDEIESDFTSSRSGNVLSAQPMPYPSSALDIRLARSTSSLSLTSHPSSTGTDDIHSDTSKVSVGDNILKAMLDFDDKTTPAEYKVKELQSQLSRARGLLKVRDARIATLEARLRRLNEEKGAVGKQELGGRQKSIVEQGLVGGDGLGKDAHENLDGLEPTATGIQGSTDTTVGYQDGSGGSGISGTHLHHSPHFDSLDTDGPITTVIQDLLSLLRCNIGLMTRPGPPGGSDILSSSRAGSPSSLVPADGVDMDMLRQELRLQSDCNRALQRALALASATPEDRKGPQMDRASQGKLSSIKYLR